MELLSLYRSHKEDSYVTPTVGTSATGRSANSRGHIGIRSLMHTVHTSDPAHLEANTIIENAI